MQKNILTIEEFLQEYKEKSSITLCVPNHPLLEEAESKFDTDDEIQRFYCLIYHTFTRKNSYIRSEFKDYYVDELYKYEMVMSYNLKTTLLSQNIEVVDKILKVCEELGIIKFNRFIDSHSEYNTQSRVYLFNSEICDMVDYRNISINKPKVLNSNFKYHFNRYENISDVHKQILNRNIIKINSDISRDVFDKVYYNPTLNDRYTAGIKRVYRRDGTSYKPSRFEYIDNFKKSSINLWNRIKYLNNDNRYLRFLDTPKKDSYGHRFFHSFISLPKSLRWHLTMDKAKVLSPYFEIDLVASQPTFNALLMQEQDYIDQNYFNDLSSNNDFYTKIKEGLGLELNRDDTKMLFMKLLFGKTKYNLFTKLVDIYPEMTKFLQKMKNRTYEEVVRDNGDISTYKQSSSNCIDLQRAESRWTEKVWIKLLENNIRFIPIHDSVIIFGNKPLNEQEVKELSNKISDIMFECFELPTNTLIIPHLKTKFNPNIYPLLGDIVR